VTKFSLHPVFDDVGHGVEADAVLLSDFQQIGQPGHRAVVIHDFDDRGERS
jgi:pyridoxine/pyridoxamine 5'-phosphate oxidase